MMSNNHFKIYGTIIIALATIVIIVFFGLKFYPGYFKLISSILTISIFLFLTWRFMSKYAFIYADFMFNQKSNEFNEDIDKPRLFIYSILWPFMIIAVATLILQRPRNANWIESLTISSIHVLFALASFACYFTWTSNFSEKFLPEISKIYEARRKEFDCTLSKLELESIFDGLVDKGFLDIIDHSTLLHQRQIFIKIFQTEKFLKSSEFKLKMDNIQTHYFSEQLKKRVFNLTLEGYLTIFSHHRPEEKPQPTPGSIRASASKAKKGPKRKNDLDSIFQF